MLILVFLGFWYFHFANVDRFIINEVLKKKNSLFLADRMGYSGIHIIIITACIKRERGKREGKLVNPFLWWWLYCAARAIAKAAPCHKVKRRQRAACCPLSFNICRGRASREERWYLDERERVSLFFYPLPLISFPGACFISRFNGSLTCWV